jgi:hypothetical protein
MDESQQKPEGMDRSRREALKLAAAVAAFGAALGFRGDAEATAPTAPTPQTQIKEQLQKKMEPFQLKMKRLEHKIYLEGRLVHACPVPQAAYKFFRPGVKFEHKWYADGRPHGGSTALLFE